MLKMKKKGQAEIIGFAIIVILLVFALIFFVRLKLGEEDNETRLIRGNLRANSALNALMKVDVGNNEQLKDLIKDCTYDKNGYCVDALYHLDHNLGAMFESSFYSFKIVDFEGNILNKDGKDFNLGYEGCEEAIAASPFVFRSGEKAELKICLREGSEISFTPVGDGMRRMEVPDNPGSENDMV
tara:strand:+ start:2927 stop:3478 length:552 start_codon:yes stop_codon:yes gene_type:complete